MKLIVFCLYEKYQLLPTKAKSRKSEIEGRETGKNNQCLIVVARNGDRYKRLPRYLFWQHWFLLMIIVLTFLFLASLRCQNLKTFPNSTSGLCWGETYSATPNNAQLVFLLNASRHCARFIIFGIPFFFLLFSCLVK